MLQASVREVARNTITMSCQIDQPCDSAQPNLVSSRGCGNTNTDEIRLLSFKTFFEALIEAKCLSQAHPARKPWPANDDHWPI